MRKIFALITTLALSGAGLALAGVASATPARHAPPPVHHRHGVRHRLDPQFGCVFKTFNGHYLTAVGGGGRVTDVIHSDATHIGSWERFTLIDNGSGTPVIQYGIKTKTGNYLTAVSGGGRITDVIHSDATNLSSWETFQLITLGGYDFAIRTINGHYLTAVGGGGRITDVIHSDATHISSWERFNVTCGH